MYNEELAKLPIGKLLSKKGTVAIWCTNSPSNLHCILEEMFPAWSVKFQAKWYWIKVSVLKCKINVISELPDRFIYFNSFLK